jgi:uncharacterized protein with PIN domain
MPGVVIDASALAAMVSGEPMAGDVVERLGDDPMSAPWLIWFELANVCLNKIKRHPHQRENFLASFRRA